METLSASARKHTAKIAEMTEQLLPRTTVFEILHKPSAVLSAAQFAT